jgi:hypothetical protein
MAFACSWALGLIAAILDSQASPVPREAGLNLESAN